MPVSRRQLRSLAALVLALWLFVLTMGTVHGCVIGHAAHTGAVDQASVPCAGASMPDDEHYAVVLGAEPLHADSLACQVFCDGESSAARAGPAQSPQAQQPQPAAVVWMAPPPSLTLALPAQQPLRVATQSGQTLARPRLPVSIVFLRLAL